MPIRSMTRRERRLFLVVNETISLIPTVSKPNVSAARAPSCAYPLPQLSNANLQPSSTQGENGRGYAGTLSPRKPTKLLVSLSSAAHNPKPSRLNPSSIVWIMASVSARLSVAGKNFITRGSAFRRANGSTSADCHRRRIRRGVSIAMNVNQSRTWHRGIRAIRQDHSNQFHCTRVLTIETTPYSSFVCRKLQTPPALFDCYSGSPSFCRSAAQRRSLPSESKAGKRIHAINSLSCWS